MIQRGPEEWNRGVGDVVAQEVASRQSALVHGHLRPNQQGLSNVRTSSERYSVVFHADFLSSQRKREAGEVSRGEHARRCALDVHVLITEEALIATLVGLGGVPEWKLRGG